MFDVKYKPDARIKFKKTFSKTAVGHDCLNITRNLESVLAGGRWI
jgi:hypothetical protein